jgi:hypothetical protein
MEPAAFRLPAPGPAQEELGATYRGLQAHEHNWHRLDTGPAGVELLALVEASAQAAQRCLHEQDWDEALWHIQRGLRFLDMPMPCAQSLALQFNLATLSLQIATALPQDDEPRARHLCDEIRDAVFEVIRGIDQVQDGEVATVALLRAADILELLGDRSDADQLRQQSLTRAGASSLGN